MNDAEAAKVQLFIYYLLLRFYAALGGSWVPCCVCPFNKPYPTICGSFTSPGPHVFPFYKYKYKESHGISYKEMCSQI